MDSVELALGMRKMSLVGKMSLERLVRAALDLCPSEGVWHNDSRMDYDEVQIDKQPLAEFRNAVKEYEAASSGQQPPGVTGDGPCCFCGEQTDSLSGDPACWPLMSPCCHTEPPTPGVPKHHHAGCVIDRIPPSIMPWIALPDGYRDQPQPKAAEAEFAIRADERERCAVEAEQERLVFFMHDGVEHMDRDLRVRKQMRDEIAKAIRSGAPVANSAGGGEPTTSIYSQMRYPTRQDMRDEIARLLGAEATLRATVDRLMVVYLEAHSVVLRAGVRPDGTAWANININDLRKKVLAFDHLPERGPRPNSP